MLPFHGLLFLYMCLYEHLDTLHPLPCTLCPCDIQMFEEQRCAFGNCRHLDEPGCVVRGDWERYEYYVSLRAELQERFDLEKKRAASKKRRQGTVRYGLKGAQAYAQAWPKKTTCACSVLPRGCH